MLLDEIHIVLARLPQWLDSLHVHPRIIGEFDDSALMKVCGQAGAGIFIVPSAIDEEVAKQFGAQIIGRTEEVR